MQGECAVEQCENDPEREVHVGFAGKVLEASVCSSCYAEMEQ